MGSRDDGLQLSHVLRLTRAGDILSRPSVSNALPLFEGPVSLVNSFYKGLRLALAAQRYLSWPGAGLGTSHAWRSWPVAEFLATMRRAVNLIETGMAGLATSSC
jgi:hypothetical protein